MNDKQPISRRAMLRGGFLATLLDGLIPDQPKKSAPTKTSPPGIEKRRAEPKRYPKTISDVTANISARRQSSIPVLRPPGAIDEATFLSECTRCDECIKACPHDSIIHAPLRMRAAAGTPMIDPIQQPCYLCEDRPCIEACEPNVLTHAADTFMGTAQITEQTCLAHIGTFCTVCSEQCPVEGAIELKLGKPHIVEETCTGCGVCQFVCPAPHNAILLMPTFNRQPRPAISNESNHD